MVQRLLLSGVLAMGTFILSGCTIPLPGSLSPETTTSGAPAKGSLWRTSDGGQTFEVKSTIDETTTITKADILSIAYHPHTQGTIYVGSVDNGIFKTEDAGEQWTPISFPPKKIYSFILDRNDPDNRMFASGVVGEWGKIFRTDDGGEEWKEVYTEPGVQANVTALSQHPTDINVIFAGTSTGTVVKSTDAGETWKNVGNKIEGTVSDILFDATQKFTTYLLTFGQKLYYSRDGGVAWLDWEEEKQKEVAALQKRASDASTNGNAKESERLQKESAKLSERNQTNKMPAGIISIASDPTRSGVIYAGTSNGFFKSADFGKYWTEINIIESAKKFPIRSIAVNPKNPDEIVFVAGKAFYKSIDSGQTWFVTGMTVDRGASFVSYDPFDSEYLFVGLRNFK